MAEATRAGHPAASFFVDTREPSRFLFYLLLGAIVLGQLARVPILAGDVKSAPLLMIDLVVAAVWVLLLMNATRRPGDVRVDAIVMLILVFVLWSLLSTLVNVLRYGLSAGETVFSLAYLARWCFYTGIYLWCLSAWAPRDPRRVLEGLKRAILAFAAFGVVQALLLPDFAFLVYPEAAPYIDWDIQGNRLVSTFLDPNFAGDLVGIGLLLLLPGVLRNGGVPTPAFLVLGVALLLTASRGAAGATVVGGVVVVWALGFRRHRAPLLRLAGWGVGIVALSLLLQALAGPSGPVGALTEFLRRYQKLTLLDPSALQRLLSWAAGLEIVRTHPFTGIGFNTLGFVQARFGLRLPESAAFGLDGGLLFVAALTGLVGVAVYGSIPALAARRGWRVARAPGPDWRQELGASAAGATALWLVHGFFVNSVFYPFLMVVMWLLWGQVSASAQRVEPGARVARPSGATARRAGGP